MTTEIERRFLVGYPPHKLPEGARLRQGYLALDRTVAVRVREADGQYVLTVKGGSGLARTEVETAIDSQQFEALWDLTDGRRIEKIRYRIEVDGGTAELDVFHGGLEGLFIVEVEFGSIDDASAFEPPQWFGAEVTDDSRWNNASLATTGRPDTT